MERERNVRKVNKVPELLAPAGNKEAFIAAVEAGADAIYCGGKGFNARAGAANFELPELKEAVAFAHKRGVKVYVTLNTLLMDEELVDALAYVGELRSIGVDALIIQDFGISDLIRRNYPDLPLHLSTQATVYDLAGVMTAKDLGFSQVVLARELSLSEIKEICAGAGGGVDIEVFCHGAICYCYSGQCQLSRAIGGRSGNRGGCAQPCRLEYESFDEEGNRLDEHYPLSPADMDFIDYLGDLAEAGVKCLKIEGRMKSPEYVAVVTSIYRKYLDMYAVRGSYEVTAEDRLALAQIFNRGFTDAYLSGDQDAGFMSGSISKNKGVFVGRVSKVTPIKGAKDRFYVDVHLEDAGRVDVESLSKGDTLELRQRKKDGIKNNSFYVTYLEDLGSGHLRLGDVKDAPERGDEVYRISSKSQLDDAAIYYKNKDWDEGKYIRRLPLRGDIVFDEDTVRLTLKNPEGHIVSAETKLAFGASGAGRVANAEGDSDANAASGVLGGTAPEEIDTEKLKGRIHTALSKTRGTPFIIEPMKIHGECRGMVSMAELNALRRAAIEQMEELMATPGFEEKSFVSADQVADYKYETLHTEEPAALELYFYSMDALARWIEVKEIPAECRVVLPLAEFFDATYEDVRNRLKKTVAEKNIFLYISNVAKGREMDLVSNYLDEAKAFCEDNGVFVYVGNLSQINLLKEKGVPFGGDFGLNIYNEAAASVVMELGVKEYVPSLEVDGVHFGQIPLMITQQRGAVSSIVDWKGRGFSFVRPEYSQQSRLVATGNQMVSGVEEAEEALSRTNGKVRYYIG